MENITTSVTQNNKIYLVHPLPRDTSTKLCFLIYYVETYNSICTLSCISLSLFLSFLPVYPAVRSIFAPS